jgi:N-acetyltransferase 10
MITPTVTPHSSTNPKHLLHTFSHSYFHSYRQDFEAVTPNVLARTVETVEGGGLVILLLKTMTSLKYVALVYSDSS